MKQYINNEHKLSTFDNLSKKERMTICLQEWQLLLTVGNIIKKLEYLEIKLGICDSVRGYYNNFGQLNAEYISKDQIKADLNYFANLHNTLVQIEDHNSNFDFTLINDLHELISDFKFAYSRITAINISAENIKDLRNNELTNLDNEKFERMQKLIKIKILLLKGWIKQSN